MKKYAIRVTILIITFLFCLALTSCFNQDFFDDFDDNEQTHTNNDSNSDTNAGHPAIDEGKKDPDAQYVSVSDIVFSSDYHEGLAVIALRADKNNYYVIDKEGKIIFSIPNDNLSNNASSQNSILIGLSSNYLYYRNGNEYKLSHYINGKMLFADGAIYDNKGNKFLPEDYGVTCFKEIDSSYIVAEKITSDYSSSKKEIGILDTNFKWVSPLSETNYVLYRNDYRQFWISTIGEKPTNATTRYEPINITNYLKHTDYIDGKAGVLMYNGESREYFVSIIDSNNNFLFTPTKVDGNGLRNVDIYYNGNHIIVSKMSNTSSGTKDSPIYLYCYNRNGEMIKKIDTLSLGICTSNGSSVTYSFSDGVIVFRIKNGTYSEYERVSQVKYYTINCEELFVN